MSEQKFDEFLKFVQFFSVFHCYLSKYTFVEEPFDISIQQFSYLKKYCEGIVTFLTFRKENYFKVRV